VDDWDAFQFELRLDQGRLQAEIINIEAYRLSLNKLILPQEWKQDLQRLYIVRAVHGTTAIEGNPLREADVARQLGRSRRTTPDDEVHRQTANAAEAFRWVEKEFARPRPIRLADALQIHRLLTTESDESDNVPGRLREAGHRVTVGSPLLGGVHRAPPGGTCLARLVDGFLEFINSDRFKAENVVVQALAAHFYFVTLHPFGNGNGRTTRCIEAAILHGGGYNTHGFYSLSNYFYRNRDQYFRMLQETRDKHRYDLTEFVLFGLRGFREELDRINGYVRNRTHRLHYREMIRRCGERRVGKRRRLLNEREARLLHWILDVSKPPDPFSDEPARQVTSEDFNEAWATLYSDKTQRTMVRELLRLTDLGFLKFERDNGAGTWRVVIDFGAIERY